MLSRVGRSRLIGAGAIVGTSVLLASGSAVAARHAKTESGHASKIVLTEEDYYTSGSALNGWNKLIAEYEKLHPNVTIQRTTIPQDEYIPHVLSQASSGALPNILMIDNPYVPEVAATGVLTPLRSLGNLPTSNLAPTELYDGIYKGTLYALPMYTNTTALFYNKKMFAAKHLSPPKTWAQLESDAKALTTKSVDGFVTDLSPAGDAAFWVLAPFLWTNAGADATSHINSPAAAAAVNVFVTMERDGSMPKAAVTWGGTQPDDLFDAGKAAMDQNGSWTIATKNAIKGLDYGVAELPTRTGQQKLLVPTGGETWTIPKSNRVTEEAAFQYLRWLDTPKVDVQEAVLQGGLVPTLKSAVGPALKQEDPTAMAPFAEELINGGTPRTKFLGKAFDAVSTTVGNAVDAAVIGPTTAQQALNHIASQVASEIKQYNG